LKATVTITVRRGTSRPLTKTRTIIVKFPKHRR
jgi:hypothetical protein